MNTTGLYKYTTKHAEKVGKAQAHDLDASYKDLTQVLRAITGLSVAKAYAKLDAAIQGEHAILYTRFNTGSGHRSELGGKKGRYPKKECKMVYATLKNAAANAVNLGLDENSLVVMHGSANKQNTFRRYRTFWVGSTTLGYGKHAMWADYVTAWMQIIVGGKPAEKKEQKTKAAAEKAKEAKEKPDAKETKEKTAKPVEAKAVTTAKVENVAAPKAEKAKSAVATQ